MFETWLPVKLLAFNPSNNSVTSVTVGPVGLWAEVGSVDKGVAGAPFGALSSDPTGRPAWPAVHKSTGRGYQLPEKV